MLGERANVILKKWSGVFTSIILLELNRSCLTRAVHSMTSDCSWHVSKSQKQLRKWLLYCRTEEGEMKTAFTEELLILRFFMLAWGSVKSNFLRMRMGKIKLQKKLFFIHFKSTDQDVLNYVPNNLFQLIAYKERTFKRFNKLQEKNAKQLQERKKCGF